MPVSQSIDSIEVRFDDDRAVADAGLLLTATTMPRLRLEQAADETVTVGYRSGRKLATLVHTLVAAGECIDDGALLRAGAMERVLGHETVAPSTIGTWLRQFTFGHIRQLDRVTEMMLTRAWAAGAGPGGRPMFIVRRTRIDNDPKLPALFASWRHHAFVTNRPGDMIELDVHHRAHAVIELAIRDLKHGAGLTHCPSGVVNANTAWLLAATLAHNLLRWTQLLGTTPAVGIGPPPRFQVARTLRRRLLTIPGRLTRSARRTTLHLPAHWPWQQPFIDTLERLRALPTPM
jgi:hypothetical protein